MYPCLEETDRSPRGGTQTSPLRCLREVSSLHQRMWGSGEIVVLLARQDRKGVMEVSGLLSTMSH